MYKIFDDASDEEINSPRYIAVEGLNQKILASSVDFGRKNQRKFDLNCALLDPFYASTVQAVHDMLWTSTAANFDEEHHTSSLMGHWASAFSWWAFVHGWSEEFMELPHFQKPKLELYWAQQSKKAESMSGGDFAIAHQIDQNRLALTFFQAKCIKPDGQVDLWRVANKERQNSDSSLIRLANSGYPDFKARNTDIHQLEKLIRWQYFGNYISIKKNNYNAKEEWCHYVLWHPSSDESAEGTPPSTPTILPVSLVKKAILPKIKECNSVERSFFKLLPDQNSSSFIDLVSVSMRSGLNCLVVTKDEANQLVGALAHFGSLPLIIGSGDTGGSGLGFFQQAFSSAGYQITPMTSGPSAIPQMTPPTQNPPSNTQPSHRGQRVQTRSNYRDYSNSN
ncbi:hypothetical protein SAE02_43000 [Skermanella aerolata]|uniref:Uncharacterized protein n=1 Tax=Skermanella aerolata TaxID=393310 RepID=A0A512DUK4_9PROT|nr:hypothetical protein [Skermanella aerolata]GEO40152.1 hypothetical protein SAE02_43000 [Skermanella aerolata]